MKGKPLPFEPAFSSGSDETITGMCQACKNGRHTGCTSLERSSEDIWPLFYEGDDDGGRFREDHSLGPLLDDADTRDQVYVPSDDWVCECLAQSTRRGDHEKHQGYLE